MRTLITPSVVIISLLSSLPTTAQVSASATTVSPLACIKSECGEKSELTHPFEDHPELVNSTYTLIENQVSLPLKVSMLRAIEIKKLHMNLLMNLKLEQIQLNPQQESVLKIIYVFSKLGELVPAIQYNDNQFSFDETVVKSVLKTEDQNLISATQALAPVIVNIMSSGDPSNLNLYIKTKYPQKTTVEALYQIATDYQTFVTKLDNLFTGFKILSQGNQSVVLDKALAKQQLSDAEKTFFAKEYIGPLNLQPALTDEIMTKFEIAKLDVTSMAKEKLDLFQKSDSVQKINNQVFLNQMISDNLLTCKKKLAYSYQALPSQAQIDFGQKMVSSILHEAHDVVQTKLQQSLSFNENFNFEVITPRARENAILYWRNSLNLNRLNNKSQIAIIQKFNQEQTSALSSTLAFMIFGGGDVTVEDTFSEFQSFCEEAKPPQLSDFAQPEMKLINLSWSTLTHPEFGYGIISHEVGHVVSAHWNSSFEKEKSCLLNVKNRQKTQQYQEEDFADLFSAIMTNKINGQYENIKLKNLGCALIPHNSQRWSEQSLHNPMNDEDNHSSNFYRVIAAAKYSHSLTPACQQYLNDVHDEGFKDFCQAE